MDWFKMQTVWGASVKRLSDAEAGRFIKALFAFAQDGEEYAGSSGREDPITWQAVETLREDIASFKQGEAIQAARKAELHEKRKRAAEARWSMQNDANASMRMHMNANASTCMHMDANALQNKKEKKNEGLKENPLKGVKEKARFTPPTAEEVAAYCRERENKVDAERFVDFYASKGWRVGNQPMKDWKAAVRTWEREKAAPRKTVTAQQYTQREYSEADLIAVSGDLIAEARKRRDSA